MKWQEGAPYWLANLDAMHTIGFLHDLESRDDVGGNSEKYNSVQPRGP
jgi:hypothetical protein